MNGLYVMVRSIVKNYPGYSINDLLDTDYRLISDIFYVKDEEVQEEKAQQAMDLGDFIKTL